MLFNKHAKVVLLTGFALKADAFTLDPYTPKCTPLKTSTDNDVLIECASVNPDGNPFGNTQKQSEWVQMCSGSEDYEDDLTLSITNKLFGGQGQDGKLTSGDCKAECVYSLANKDVDSECSRTAAGYQCDGYMAYHWKNENSCWERVTADWCLTNVEMPKMWDLDSSAVLAWRFPAFKVKSFCSSEDPQPTIPTSRPTAHPVIDDAISDATVPETCVNPDDGYDCRHRYVMGFCNMSDAIRDSFKARCPGCCEESSDPSPKETESESPTTVNGRRRGGYGRGGRRRYGYMAPGYDRGDAERGRGRRLAGCPTTEELMKLPAMSARTICEQAGCIYSTDTSDPFLTKRMCMKEAICLDQATLDGLPSMSARTMCEESGKCMYKVDQSDPFKTKRYCVPKGKVGVIVLDGGNGKFAKSMCVPPTVKKLNGVRIAAQCCLGNVCKRYQGTNDDAGCMVGYGGPEGTITATTHAEAQALCAAKGMTLCEKNCAWKGCNYNHHPVWTSQSCTGPSVSTPEQ